MTTTAESATTVTSSTPRDSTLLLTASGVPLGALAFLGDELPDATGQIVLTLTSNGFAWGAAALVAGYLVRRARRAPVVATALLLVATTLYYGLILVVSRRWSGGTLEDGSSADLYGLMSVARAAGFWLLISVAAGLVLGSLGHLVRSGPRRRSSAAAGLAFGMLAAEGLNQLSHGYYWPIPDSFVQVIVISNAVTVSLSLVVTVLLLVFRGPSRSWWLYLGSAAVAGGLGAVLWSFIDMARGSGFGM
ncbi:DUF6518 family protein [Catellatospora bangladeshensis]|uniref:Uncharacterized protein n=1 Tax=Catellatospora bangladeshensis TaxID=310355 RepID=A0A8J3JWD4_9ACTN|nr:DUF6518 family protein [Catellatospora bangladeshensis]GIF84294.1 hypothetical protein Cba03nite_56430 [Catellatospora bangladeshensis]